MKGENKPASEKYPAEGTTAEDLELALKPYTNDSSNSYTKFRVMGMFEAMEKLHGSARFSACNKGHMAVFDISSDCNGEFRSITYRILKRADKSWVLSNPYELPVRRGYGPEII